MKKRMDRSRLKLVLITIGSVLFVLFVIIPVLFSLFDGPRLGNVALIPIEGAITGNGAQSFGASSASSKDLVEFIEAAEDNPQVKVLLLEINSPGGSAVASDEVAAAVKKVDKPVVALIREAGASGAYWIASASDHIIANRMSITGSIGVLSSYLEFSGLMEDYNVTYQRLVAGENKDMGTPFKKLSEQERTVLQSKLDTIHQYFIEEVAINRNLDISRVKVLATGEFYLGVEALNFGLVDALGDKDTAEDFIQQNYDLEEIDYIVYQHEAGFLEALAGVFSDFSFHLGEGIGSALVGQQGVRI
ncbi:signal peptide peptidase SppA [Candidatus Woesearchaeota archaeon]|nr:signal peptide peptidase SppA [Candidatus Woesearchaeota archaeon]MBI2582592.1 signal peptide peptidase SppA [Candidatus Woesearchaeota archaeon]